MNLIEILKAKGVEDDTIVETAIQTTESEEN